MTGWGRRLPLGGPSPQATALLHLQDVQQRRRIAEEEAGRERTPAALRELEAALLAESAAVGGLAEVIGC